MHLNLLLILTLRCRRSLEFTPEENNDIHILYHASWWPGDIKSHGISNNGIGIAMAEHFGFSTTRINPGIGVACVDVAAHYGTRLLAIKQCWLQRRTWFFRMSYAKSVITIWRRVKVTLVQFRLVSRLTYGMKADNLSIYFTINECHDSLYICQCHCCWCPGPLRRHMSSIEQPGYVTTSRQSGSSVPYTLTTHPQCRGMLENTDRWLN